jgi:nucleoside-diphosphate-sugar epimerase
MKVLITGGSGFLGARLVRTLLSRGTLLDQPVKEVLIADLVDPPEDLLADSRVLSRTGNLVSFCSGLGERFDAVFHLAAAVSGECEADFDLGMRTNLDSTRALLESLRATGGVPRFVFSSSIAVFGSDPYVPMPPVIRDETLPTPQSSYGFQKFVCEQLVAEYTRRGFIRGRAARLMTVSVRPGKPNRAASSFLSGIIREPLAGKETICPVSPDTEVALASPARAIEGLLAVAEATTEAFGGRTALNLPALSVRVRDMLDALETVAGVEIRNRVRFEPDETIARIVGSWPARFDNSRAKRLGLHADPDFRSVIEQYITDSSSSPQSLRALQQS